jgi:NADPH:quinone reductase-like Zn-dependent oxidoreductase
VELAARVRPVSEARQRLLPVVPALAPLFPDGALRRGSTTLVAGAGGGTTLAMALLAGASAAGCWCAAVGLADPGVVALAELGVDLSRVVLTPYPGPRWAEVAGDLLRGVDLVLVRPPGRARLTVTRHLMACGRERGAALVVLAARPEDWPVPADVVLRVESGEWHGVDGGHGHLAGRRAEVWAGGRRWAGGGTRHALELPAASGVIAAPAEARDPSASDGEPAVAPAAAITALPVDRVAK